MSQPATTARPSWFLLNLKEGSVRPLSQRGGGPSTREHISVVRVLSTCDRLHIIVVDAAGHE